MRKYYLSILSLGLFINCMHPTGGTMMNRSSRIVKLAESYLGVPYRFGGMNRRGMDCSGLICRIYRDFDQRRLPHSVRQLFKQGRPVIPSQIRPGDCLFFAEPGKKVPTHMGIVVSATQFIHASQRRGVVRTRWDTPYFKKRLRGVRRF